MKRGLYIGKFQPFHIGHLDIVKCIDSEPDIDEIIIATGSSQWDWQNRNPERPWMDNIFSGAEAKEIIKKSIQGNVSKKVHIIPVLDFLPKWGADSTQKWFNYIKNHAPEFHCLFTNRDREVELFSKAGYETRSHRLKYDFSATVIREKMAYGGVWQPFVVPQAVDTIKKLNGEKRASILFARDEVYSEDHEDLCWEWRTFDRINKDEIKKVLNLPIFKNQEIIDRYLFSPVRTSVNFKLRKDGFKIKKLLKVQDNLELWTSFTSSYPVDRDWLVDGCREIKFPFPLNLPNKVYEKDLLEKTSKDFNPYLFLLSLKKKRFMRLFENKGIRCGVDFNLFTLNGREIMSLGLESENKEGVEMALDSLGLRKYKLTNYLQFLERFVCMETKNEIWKKLQ